MASLNINIPGQLVAHGDHDAIVVATAWAGAPDNSELSTFISTHGLVHSGAWSEIDAPAWEGGGCTSKTYVSARVVADINAKSPERPWAYSRKLTNKLGPQTRDQLT